MEPAGLFACLLVVPIVVGWVADWVLHFGSWLERKIAGRRG